MRLTVRLGTLSLLVIALVLAARRRRVAVASWAT